MARTVNNVTLLGNVGGDPEVRQLNNGGTVAEFRLATHRTFNDRNGEQQRETEWHSIVCYDKLAESVANYVTKGRSVYIEGRLRTRQWEDKETGGRRERTEIIAREVLFLDRRNEGPVTSSVEEEENTEGELVGSGIKIGKIKL